MIRTSNLFYLLTYGVFGNIFIEVLTWHQVFAHFFEVRRAMVFDCAERLIDSSDVDDALEIAGVTEGFVELC